MIIHVNTMGLSQAKCEKKIGPGWLLESFTTGNSKNLETDTEIF